MNLRDLTQEALGRLNSATKYPPIPTYHEMGSRGCLGDAVAVSFEEGDDLLVTEKVDGTNVRILVADESFVIGSREEFLYASGDLIQNPSLGIVDGVLETANTLRRHAHPMDGAIYVFYGELYGGQIGKAAKGYAPSGRIHFRLFDIGVLLPTGQGEILAMEREAIARWRQGGGQTFSDFTEVEHFATRAGVDVVPRIGVSRMPPADLEGAFSWLCDALADAKGDLRSRVAIDEDARPLPEGVVVRTPHRSKIAKMRVEDYRRTLKKRQEKK